MITGLLQASSLLPTLGIAVLVFGFLPGFVLSLIVRAYQREDPRRRELLAELYAVPRWERPFWVVEQLEVATREVGFPVIEWWFGRLVWHRSHLESGLAQHQAYPESFEIPDEKEKKRLRPGDTAKLMWTVRGLPGERMWVEILERRGDRCVGRLKNSPLFVYLQAGELVSFDIDDIIDCHGPDQCTVDCSEGNCCCADQGAA